MRLGQLTNEFKVDDQIVDRITDQSIDLIKLSLNIDKKLIGFCIPINTICMLKRFFTCRILDLIDAC